MNGSGDAQIDEYCGDRIRRRLPAPATWRSNRSSAKTLQASHLRLGRHLYRRRPDRAAEAPDLRIGRHQRRRAEIDGGESRSAAPATFRLASPSAEITVMGSGDVSVTGGAKCMSAAAARVTSALLTAGLQTRNLMHHSSQQSEGNNMRKSIARRSRRIGRPRRLQVHGAGRRRSDRVAQLSGRQFPADRGAGTL